MFDTLCIYCVRKIVYTQNIIYFYYKLIYTNTHKMKQSESKVALLDANNRQGVSFV